MTQYMLTSLFNNFGKNSSYSKQLVIVNTMPWSRSWRGNKYIFTCLIKFQHIHLQLKK